jgi:hypothetical protein
MKTNSVSRVFEPGILGSSEFSGSSTSTPAFENTRTKESISLFLACCYMWLPVAAHPLCVSIIRDRRQQIRDSRRADIRQQTVPADSRQQTTHLALIPPLLCAVTRNSPFTDSMNCTGDFILKASCGGGRGGRLCGRADCVCFCPCF